MHDLPRKLKNDTAGTAVTNSGAPPPPASQTYAEATATSSNNNPLNASGRNMGRNSDTTASNPARSSETPQNHEREVSERDNDGQESFTVVQNNRRRNRRRISSLHPASNNNNRNANRGGAPSLPRRRNQQGPSSRRSNIAGEGLAVPGLSTGQRVLDIFVGGCSVDSTMATISDYVSNKGVPPLKCTDLASRSEWHKCYKLSVNAENRDKLLDPNFWPTGIFVNKYFRPKNMSNINHS